MTTIEEAKQIYIKGKLSQKELSGLTGIPLSTIRRVAKDEQWSKQKKLGAPHLTSNTELVSENIIPPSANLLENDMANKIIILLNNVFNEAQQFNKYVTKLRSLSESGAVEELVEVQLSTFDISKISSAISAFEKAIKIRRSLQAEIDAQDAADTQGVIILPEILIDDCTTSAATEGA